MEGTIANMILNLKSDILDKKPLYYSSESIKSASVEVPSTGVYIVTSRVYVTANANARTSKVYILECWVSVITFIELATGNGGGSCENEINTEVVGRNTRITVSGKDSTRTAGITAVKLM